MQIKHSIMPTQNLITQTTEPVFIMSKYLPDKIDVITMCRSAEVVSGVGSIKGAYGDGGLWRIYPKTAVARALLISKGITINRQRIQPELINPFILQGSDSEIPATRLSVGPLAFSYSDEFIIRNLEKLGLRLRSKLIWENERYKDKSMSDWANGKRFVWIDLPKVPPKEFVYFGSAKVKLFYREMREQRIKCYNCQQFGHKAQDCTSDPVCFACSEVGHKKDDPICSHFSSPGDDDNEDQGLKCGRCLEYGHSPSHCINDVVCYDCKDKGHKSGDPACTLVKDSVKEGGASVSLLGRFEDERSESEEDEDYDDGSDDDESEDDEDDDENKHDNNASLRIEEEEEEEGDEGDDCGDHNDACNSSGEADVGAESEECAADKGPQNFDHSQICSEDGERYVIDGDKVMFDEDLSPTHPESGANSTFTYTPQVETEPGSLVQSDNFMPAESQNCKNTFPEYDLSDDEDADDNSGEVISKVRSYADVVSGNESAEEEGKEKVQKEVKKKVKKSCERKER